MAFGEAAVAVVITAVVAGHAIKCLLCRQTRSQRDGVHQRKVGIDAGSGAGIIEFAGGWF